MGVVLDIFARDTSDKKVLTASEYRREGADYTGQQLAELYEGLKSNFDYIDRTKHLRAQFIITPQFRIFKPVWFHYLASLVFPWVAFRSYTLNKSVKLLFISGYLLTALYLILGVFETLFDNASSLSSFTFWTPAILYLITGFIYATQKATWTADATTQKKLLRKLSDYKLICFKDDVYVEDITAKDVVNDLIDSIEKRSDRQKRRLLILPTLVSMLFCIAFYRDRSAVNDHSTSVASFYKNIVALLGSLLTSVFVMTIVSEYTYSLYYLNQRLQLLNLLNAITHKNKAGKRNIYHFKLNTPENIVSWYKIRKCLKCHNGEQFAFFQVYLAIVAVFLSVAIITLFLSSFMSGAIFNLPISLLVLLSTFGLYMIATMWLGAFLDLVQKQHIKTVIKQKWKLQSSLMKFNTTAKDMIVAPKKLFSDDEEDISEESDSDSEEQTVVTDPKQIIAQHEQLEKEAAQLAQKYRQQRRKNSVGGTPKQQAQSKKAKKAVELSPDQIFSPTSLYEPIRGLESEIARNCQSLLSKLSKTLEKTDQPLRLLMIKVDFSFAVKITGIIFSALVSQFMKRRI